MTLRQRSNISIKLGLIALSGAWMVACGAGVPPNEVSMESAADSATSGAPVDPTADLSAVDTIAAEVPRALPQLIKTAEMSLEVEDINRSLEAVSDIVRQQQGDIIGLNNVTPQDPSDRHQAFLELRVPQQNLEAALEALSAIGTVQQQSLSAEDVSNQLVDFEARLRNLRQSEEMLLGIMERSGEMSEVLQVSQEISRVRATIEQIDAQLNNLKNQVAFSTIRLNLNNPGGSTLTEPGLGNKLATTWQGATESMGDLTVGLMQLLIWLMVYSPYWLPVIGIAYWQLSRTKRSRSLTQPVEEQQTP